MSKKSLSIEKSKSLYKMGKYLLDAQYYLYLQTIDGVADEFPDWKECGFTVTLGLFNLQVCSQSSTLYIIYIYIQY